MKSAGEALPKRRSTPLAKSVPEGSQSKRTPVKRKACRSDEGSEEDGLSILAKTDPALALYFQTAQTWADNMRLFLQTRITASAKTVCHR